MRTIIIAFSFLFVFLSSAEARCPKGDGYHGSVIIKLAEKELQKNKLSEEERFERAIKKLTNSINKKDLCPLDEALLRSQRATYYASGPSINVEDALKDLRRVIELESLPSLNLTYHYKSYDLLQHLLFVSSQYEELKTILFREAHGLSVTRGIGKGPDASQLYRLAVVSFFQENYALAAEYIETAINIDGLTDEFVFLPLMEAIYTKLKRPQSALGVFERYAEKHPSDKYIQERIRALKVGEEQEEIFGKQHVNFLGIRSRIRGAYATNRRPPDYPSNCVFNAGIVREFRIVIKFTIGIDGKPKDFKRVSEANPCLSKSAIEAITQWEFEPALLNGRPVEEHGIVETFTLYLK